MQSNEKKNENENFENRTTEATAPIEEKNTNQSALLFNRNCSVCNCGHLQEVHLWRGSMTLESLAEKLNAEFGLNLNKHSLSRHFMHYTEQLQVASAKALWQKFNQDVESVANHQKKVLFISNIAFQHILDRLEAGTLRLGVDEFEKMIKLYYSVLRDPDSAGDANIITIFQRASEKYGCSLEQGVLIKQKKLLD